MIERYSIPRKEKIKRANEEDAWGIFSRLLTGLREVSLSKNFTVTENPELGYRRFVKGDASNVDFELLVSNEAEEILKKKGKIRSKKVIKANILSISRDPFGVDSIDPSISFTDSNRFIEKRSVNSVSKEMEDVFGLPVAVKGLGLNIDKQEDLIEQFVAMKKLDKDWESLSPYVKHIIRLCKVYAVVKYKIPGKQEFENWLIMERVPFAEHAGDIKGFNVNSDPLLARIVQTEIKNAEKFLNNGFYSWYDLTKALDRAGLKLPDLAGRNLLYSRNHKKDKQYVIIDQGGRKE